VLEVEGAGERIWEEFGVRQLCGPKGVSVVRLSGKRWDTGERGGRGYRFGGGLEVMAV